MSGFATSHGRLYAAWCREDFGRRFHDAWGGAAVYLLISPDSRAREEGIALLKAALEEAFKACAFGFSVFPTPQEAIEELLALQVHHARIHAVVAGLTATPPTIDDWKREDAISNLALEMLLAACKDAAGEPTKAIHGKLSAVARYLGRRRATLKSALEHAAGRACNTLGTNCALS